MGPVEAAFAPASAKLAPSRDGAAIGQMSIDARKHQGREGLEKAGRDRPGGGLPVAAMSGRAVSGITHDRNNEITHKDNRTLMSNRQNGRRRGRNTPRPQGGSGNGRGDSGNRIDSRARGNAAQMLEKYKNMARDAQLQGDRVQTEYYLQFADHYFRVVNDFRARQEEQQAGQANQQSVGQNGQNAQNGQQQRGRRDENRPQDVRGQDGRAEFERSGVSDFDGREDYEGPDSEGTDAETGEPIRADGGFEDEPRDRSREPRDNRDSGGRNDAGRNDARRVEGTRDDWPARESARGNSARQPRPRRPANGNDAGLDGVIENNGFDAAILPPALGLGGGAMTSRSEPAGNEQVIDAADDAAPTPRPRRTRVRRDDEGAAV